MQFVIVGRVYSTAGNVLDRGFNAGPLDHFITGYSKVRQGNLSLVRIDMGGPH